MNETRFSPGGAYVGPFATRELWRVAVGGDQVHNMAPDEIARAFQAGQLNLRTPVWPPGATGWQALGNFEQLKGSQGNVGGGRSRPPQAALASYDEEEAPTRMWMGDGEPSWDGAETDAGEQRAAPAEQAYRPPDPTIYATVTAPRAVPAAAPAPSYPPTGFTATPGFAVPTVTARSASPPAPAIEVQPMASAERVRSAPPMAAGAVSASVGGASLSSVPPFVAKRRGASPLVLAGMGSAAVALMAVIYLALRNGGAFEPAEVAKARIGAETPKSPSGGRTEPADPAKQAQAQDDDGDADALPKAAVAAAKTGSAEQASAFVAGPGASAVAAKATDAPASAAETGKADKSDDTAAAEDEEAEKPSSRRATRAARSARRVRTKRTARAAESTVTTIGPGPVAAPRAAAPAPPAASSSDPDDAPSANGSTLDTKAAKTALDTASTLASSCRPQGGPSGQGRARVRFANDGSVQSVEILTEAFRDTLTGSCVGMVFRRSKVPPFKGDSPTFIKGFTIPSE